MSTGVAIVGAAECDLGVTGASVVSVVDGHPSVTELQGHHGPLVVVARAAASRADSWAWLRTLVDARPDTLVVELGWPSPEVAWLTTVWKLAASSPVAWRMRNRSRASVSEISSTPPSMLSGVPGRASRRKRPRAGWWWRAGREQPGRVLSEERREDQHEGVQSRREEHHVEADVQVAHAVAFPGCDAASPDFDFRHALLPLDAGNLGARRPPS